MSDNEQMLTAIEQKNVLFMEDDLIAVKADDGHIYVSIRHLCQALKLDRYGQIQRIRRQDVLEDGHYQIEIGTAGGNQTMNMLRVDLVPLFLTGINTGRIKDAAVKEKLELYQRQAAKVLWEAFQSGVLSTDTNFDDLLAGDSPAAQAYKMASAIMQMARQQILLENQLQTHTQQLVQHENRLEQIETQLGESSQQVSPSQAMQISQAVKAIAMALSKRSGRNEYGGVYGEFYRKFGITSYKLLPAKRFQDAMKFLSDWYSEITDLEQPF